MSGFDVGIIALPDRRASYAAMEAAIQAGLNVVDILEEFHRRPDPYETEGLVLPEGMTLHEYGEWLHESAVRSGVVILDGMGFAPGLSNITVGEGIRKMDTAISAVARVGGIPSKETASRHPLRYLITWEFEHVLREYNVRTNVIQKGQVIEVSSLEGFEEFVFDHLGKNEPMECAITPGMPSFIYTHPQLQEFAEKTIRWPGHYEGIKVLRDCGLLSIDPVVFGGTEVVPRKFVSSIIGPRLCPQPGDCDISVMYNTVVGLRGDQQAKIDYFMWEEDDKVNGFTSMARVTGFTAAIGARFVLRGLAKGPGIVAPEECIRGEVFKLFMDELKKRNILIEEKISLSEQLQPV
jgi:saccharopine dehydrogenase-like NADP-dependent oxidoreductase